MLRNQKLWVCQTRDFSELSNPDFMELRLLKNLFLKRTPGFLESVPQMHVFALLFQKPLEPPLLSPYLLSQYVRWLTNI